MFTELIGLFIIILSAAYIYYKFVIFNFWRKRDVFYIEPTVPIGNLAPLITKKTSLAEFFGDLYAKYKDHRAFGIYTFFKPNLVITDLDLIRTVLTKEFGSFHDRGVYCNEEIDPLTGNLFNLNGKKWRDIRVKLTPTFTSGKIKQMFAILKETSDELVKYLENDPETKKGIEIKEIFGRYTTDVIMSTAFGIKADCITKPDNEYRYWGKKIFETGNFWGTLIAFAPKVMEFFSIPEADRGVIKFFIRLFRENVEYRKSNNIVRHDFMNLMIQLVEKGYVESDNKDEDIIKGDSNTKKLTMNEATAQSFVFFAAGFETSSTTATYCLYELAIHQDIQERVRQEINETLKKHGGMTYDAVNEMTYLHQVINEALRKYPPVSILNRICTKEISLPTTNIHMPKDTLISIPVYGVHHDPSIYPDPEKFDPERFNAENVAGRHPYAYLPFGEGPRNCIGMRFGYIQTKIGLIGLLTKFRFKLDSRTPVPLVLDRSTFITTAKDGVYLSVDMIK